MEEDVFFQNDFCAFFIILFPCPRVNERPWIFQKVKKKRLCGAPQRVKKALLHRQDCTTKAFGKGKTQTWVSPRKQPTGLFSHLFLRFEKENGIPLSAESGHGRRVPVAHNQGADRAGRRERRPFGFPAIF